MSIEQGRETRSFFPIYIVITIFIDMSVEEFRGFIPFNDEAMKELCRALQLHDKKSFLPAHSIIYFRDTTNL